MFDLFLTFKSMVVVVIFTPFTLPPKTYIHGERERQRERERERGGIWIRLKWVEEFQR